MLTEDQLRRLRKSCDGHNFTARRDTAIIRLFSDTGVRVSQAAGILLPEDLDLDLVVIVLGKGAVSAPCRLVAGPPWRWTATCACAPATPSRICPTCGSVLAAR